MAGVIGNCRHHLDFGTRLVKVWLCCEADLYSVRGCLAVNEECMLSANGGLQRPGGGGTQCLAGALGAGRGVAGQPGAAPGWPFWWLQCQFGDFERAA